MHNFRNTDIRFYLKGETEVPKLNHQVMEEENTTSGEGWVEPIKPHSTLEQRGIAKKFL